MFRLDSRIRETRRSPAGRVVRPRAEALEAICLLSGDPILRWNQIALDAVAADSRLTTQDEAGPTRAARALAVVHLAMFDAANAIDREYSPYLLRSRAPRNASIQAAVATAARRTLAAMFPQQARRFTHECAIDMKEVPDGPRETAGTRIGRLAAEAMLRARRNDGAAKADAFQGHNIPGMFQQYPGEPTPLGVYWGDVRPFGLRSANQFPTSPPPVLNSPEYTTAYNEVRDYGGDGVSTPTKRTAEQTEIGLFWAYDGAPGLGTPPRLYNQIARVIAEQEHNTALENARVFALTNMALADAGIACWWTKYRYEIWRPIRGIRQTGPAGESLDDGNPDTVADPSWTPLGAPCTNHPPDQPNFTPPFPSYASGHATFGAAFFRTLRDIYGRDDIAFTFTSDELNGVNKNQDGTVRPLSPRSFASFSQATEENGQSRIYLGIHWAFDKTEGIKQGDAIADYLSATQLRPLAAPGRAAAASPSPRGPLPLIRGA